MFGSYRREKFTENEGNPTDIGVDLMLSTLFPLSPIVKDVESTGGAANALNYSAFFNVEGSVFVTLAYNWEIFLNAGYFSYDTRKQNQASSATQPVFTQFTLSAIPLSFGREVSFRPRGHRPLRWAWSWDRAHFDRKGFYDNNSTLIDDKTFE